ncbi:hypothetical protein ACWGS9_19915 [Bradyrhizobium sp. Arg314]
MLTDNATEDTPLPARNVAGLPTKGRRSRGRRPGEPMAALFLDRRTSEWTRRAELIALFTKALGGPVAPLLASRIEKAAELAVVAERTRARLLAGEAGITVDDVVRAERVAALAERALNIGKAPPSKPRPSLREQLAHEQLANEARPAA